MTLLVAGEVDDGRGDLCDQWTVCGQRLRGS